jgi:hypothetical protein
MYVGVFDPASGVLPTSFFTGRIYGIIAIKRALTAAELASTEAWVNGKTEAY